MFAAEQSLSVSFNLGGSKSLRFELFHSNSRLKYLLYDTKTVKSAHWFAAKVGAIRTLSNIYLASEMPGESVRAANEAVQLSKRVHVSRRFTGRKKFKKHVFFWWISDMAHFSCLRIIFDQLYYYCLLLSVYYMIVVVYNFFLSFIFSHAFCHLVLNYRLLRKPRTEDSWLRTWFYPQRPTLHWRCRRAFWMEKLRCQCRASWIAWFFIVAGQPQRLSQGLGEISEACEGSLQGTFETFIIMSCLRLVVHYLIYYL